MEHLLKNITLIQRNFRYLGVDKVDTLIVLQMICLTLNKKYIRNKVKLIFNSIN